VDISSTLARLVVVLGNRRNREVFAALDEGHTTVRDLATKLGISQPTLSRALANLSTCGLVTRERLQRDEVGRPEEIWSQVRPRATDALVELEAIATDLKAPRQP
jgi:predicted ArsR family transcriptional regulator